MSHKKRMTGAAVIAVLLACPCLFSQSSQETESKVPEHAAFHEIIYPIWHTAYPQKDYAALRKFGPEVKRLAEKIYAAKLPGILRDKEATWKEGLVQFIKTVDDYLTAVAGTNDAAILSAAEALHMRYELLGRVIAPVLKEVDDFHKVLYAVIHKSLPEKKYSEIKAASGDLLAKAEAVAKADLPKRLEAKTETFKAAAAELLQAAKDLDGVMKSGDNSAVDGAVNKLHAKYQALEALFK